MDTSEEYIKMCDCEEVQGQWEDRKHLFDYRNGRFQAERLITGEFSVNCFHNEGAIWLPRRDQIQEMLEIKSVDDFYFASYTMFFDSDGYHHYNAEPDWRTDKLATVEQRWLAFYMHEKHLKTWDGKKWEKHNAK